VNNEAGAPWPADEPPSGLTLIEWAAWRGAEDWDAIAAVRALLEDFEAGHAIVRARALARATLH